MQGLLLTQQCTSSPQGFFLAGADSLTFLLIAPSVTKHAFHPDQRGPLMTTFLWVAMRPAKASPVWAPLRFGQTEEESWKEGLMWILRQVQMQIVNSEVSHSFDRNIPVLQVLLTSSLQTHEFLCS